MGFRSAPRPFGLDQSEPQIERRRRTQILVRVEIDTVALCLDHARTT